MKKVAFLISLAVFLFYLPAQSQKVTFFSENDTISFGQSSYTASIKVADFKSIVGAQFTLTWDSTVLAYSDVTDFGFDLSYDDNFGRDQASSGILRFAWFNASLAGINLPDSATLFSVDFQVVGDPASSSPIAFRDQPTAREVYDTSFAIIPAEFNDGSLMIQSATVSSLSADPTQLDIRSLTPNPMGGDATQLRFFLRESDTLWLRIVSINGADVYRSRRFFTAGQHSLELPAHIFPGPGMYLVQIHNNRFITTDKLMVTD